MKKLQIDYVIDQDGDKHPILFSNGAFMAWQDRTGADFSATFVEGTREITDHELVLLFYFAIKHGYMQVNGTFDYSEDDVIEQLNIDEHMAKSCLETYQKQWLRKLRSRGLNEEAEELEKAWKESQNPKASASKKDSASEKPIESAVAS